MSVTPLQLTSRLTQSAASCIAQLHGCGCSVERIIEYTTRHEPEAPAVIDGNRPPQDWPQRGCIDFQGLVVRYRPGLPPVLKGLTFCIRPQEKVSTCFLRPRPYFPPQAHMHTRTCSFTTLLLMHWALARQPSICHCSGWWSPLL